MRKYILFVQCRRFQLFYGNFFFVSKYQNIASIYLPLSRFLSMKQKWTLKCIHKNTYISIWKSYSKIFVAFFVPSLLRWLYEISIEFIYSLKYILNDCIYTGILYSLQNTERKICKFFQPHWIFRWFTYACPVKLGCRWCTQKSVHLCIWLPKSLPFFF